jgi:hypothetical protein
MAITHQVPFKPSDGDKKMLNNIYIKLNIASRANMNIRRSLMIKYIREEQLLVRLEQSQETF